MLMDFKGIKNIIFDLGGVILPIDISKTTEAYRELGISRIDELFGLGHADSFFKDYEQGKIEDDEFVGKVKRLVPGAVPDEVIIHAWNALLLDFPPEIIAFLKALKNRYRLFLFSNTNGIHHRSFIQHYREVSGGEDFDDLFEKAWYSHIIKRRKPDVSSFQFIVNEGKIEPGETLFIDDALVNVEGAIKAGLQGIHLERGKTILDIGL